MNTPHSDHSDPLIAALQRDAARIQPPPFDPSLHREAMRRIRAMEEIRAPRWKPALAWAAVLIVPAICAGLWFSRGPQIVAHRPPVPEPDLSAVLEATRTVRISSISGTAAPLSPWMSPTASLLEPLHLSPTNPKQP